MTKFNGLIPWGNSLYYSYFVSLSLLSRSFFIPYWMHSLNMIWIGTNSCFCLVCSLHSVFALVCCKHDEFFSTGVLDEILVSIEDIWQFCLVDRYKRFWEENHLRIGACIILLCDGISPLFWIYLNIRRCDREATFIITTGNTENLIHRFSPNKRRAFFLLK
jgi:hypothetical protein